MNPNQALATRPSTAVARYGDEAQIEFEMNAMRASLPGAAQKDDNGQFKLSAELLRGLVIASKYSGLNPYAGEIYAIPGVGVMTATKIKASDAITAAQRRGDTLTIRFETILPGSDIWNEHADEYDLRDGDTVRGCWIISGAARNEYWRNRMYRIQELQALGYGGPDIEARLKTEFPTPPVFFGIGVVKSTEYDGIAKKIKYNAYVAYTRADKADKRALMRVLNKHGLAAPDARQYGGVQIADEDAAPRQNAVDAAFTVVPGVQTDNPFPGPVDDAPPQAPGPDQAPTDQAPEHDDAARRRAAMRGSRNSATGDAPFGGEATQPAAKLDAQYDALPTAQRGDKMRADLGGLIQQLQDAGQTQGLRELRPTVADTFLMLQTKINEARLLADMLPTA